MAKPKPDTNTAKPDTNPSAAPGTPPPDPGPSTQVLMAEWEKLTKADADRLARVSEIETMIAKRLATKGKGAFVVMPDGKKYNARVYGAEVSGPMRGKTILVERKEGKQVEI